MSRRASKKSGAKTSASTKPKPTPKPKSRSGESFERRARDAIQFINEGSVAIHNEKLANRYHRKRQFDIAVRDRSDRLQALYEAKDRNRPTEIEKVEAFETKVRELVERPERVAGLVSAHGFQEGPIQRAKILGDEIMTRELYHLRPVEDADWEGRIRHLNFLLNTVWLLPKDVEMLFEGPGESVAPLGAERRDCFVENAEGDVVGNVLDLINDKLRALSVGHGNDDALPRQTIEFPRDSFFHVGDQRLRLVRVSFTPSPSKQRSTVTVDLASAARDLLIDCVGDKRWIIPDPARAIRASRTGMDLAIDFKKAAAGKRDTLFSDCADVDADDQHTDQVLRSLQVQMALAVLRREPEVAPPPLAARLQEATDAFNDGDLETAERLYRESLSESTSLAALVNLTFIESKRGNFEEALRLCGHAITLFPFEVIGYSNALHLLLGKGRDSLAEARRVLQLAKVLHSGRQEILEAEAELLVRERKWNEAARVFVELALSNRQAPTPRFGLALCEQAAGRTKNAAYEAVEAWKLGERTVERVIRLLDIVIAGGRHADALEICREMLRSTDDKRARRAFALRAIASAHEQSDLAAAEEGASYLDETDPMFAYVAGIIALRKGDAGEARLHFRAHLERQPNDVRALWNASIAASAVAQYAEAFALARSPALVQIATAEYWSMRAVAAAAADDAEDALNSVERGGKLGADRAATLMRASSQASKAGRDAVAGRLRMAALEYETSDGESVLDQALLRIHLAMVGEGELGNARAEVDRAERLGASPAIIVFARFLLAVHDDTGECETLAARPETSQWTDNALVHAAAEAEIHARSRLALALLDRVRDSSQNLTFGPWPHPVALRASALLRLGSFQEARALVPCIRGLPEHPFHFVVQAYAAYGEGLLQDASALLDRAQSLEGRDVPVELLLRFQILAERGAYRRLAELLAKHLPSSTLAGRVSALAALGDPDVDAIARQMAADGSNPLAFVGVGDREAEHGVVFRRGEALARVIVSVRDWSAALTCDHDAERGGSPVLVRAAKVTWRTIMRLRPGAR